MPKNAAKRFRKLAKNASNHETLALLLAPESAIFDSQAPVVVVSEIFIPAQTSSPDECAMTRVGNEQLATHCHEHSLSVVGWLHTHPTHGKYPSSIDLHQMFERYERHSVCDVSVILQGREREGKPDKMWAWTLTSHGVKNIGKCRKDGFHSDHDVTKCVTKDFRFALVRSPHTTTLIDVRQESDSESLLEEVF